MDCLAVSHGSRRLALAAGLTALILTAVAAPRAAASVAGDSVQARAGEPTFVPGEVLVRLNGKRERRYELPERIGVREAVRALAGSPRVDYAVPNYIARAAAPFIPDDPGRSAEVGGWRRDQWNFLGGPGIRAPRAWENLIKQGKPGGKAPIVAVIDTGVAYTSQGRYTISPDFVPQQFVRGRDLVDGDSAPLDANGHGTHIAGTIGEQVDNGVALTGLAYGARIMPIRVLNGQGRGNSRNVARGIRWSAKRGARVLNLSLEFLNPNADSCEGVPNVCRAIKSAWRRGAVVVAAAGNTYSPYISFPARAPRTLAVGATTDDGCLARYSGHGRGLDLVAPGGGGSRPIDDRGCRRQRNGRPIYQLSFERPRYDEFEIRGEQGTSMAAAHVSAAAALVRAGWRVHGRRSPRKVVRRLKRSASKVGPRRYYGAGLLNAARATRSR